jgi:hypothetical protein
VDGTGRIRPESRPRSARSRRVRTGRYATRPTASIAINHPSSIIDSTLTSRRANGEPGSVARELPLRMIRHDRAVQNVLQGGVMVDGKLNPLFPTLRRILDCILRISKRLARYRS